MTDRAKKLAALYKLSHTPEGELALRKYLAESRTDSTLDRLAKAVQTEK